MGARSRPLWRDLEQRRREAFAAGDAEALAAVLREATAAGENADSRAVRRLQALAADTEQNIRFLTRRDALAAGERWDDPFAAAEAQPEPRLRPKRLTRKQRLAAVSAAAAVLAATVVGGVAAVRIIRGSAPPVEPEDEIAFSRGFGVVQNGGIYVIHADGSGLRRLTKAPDKDPSWSPDGKRIAFVRISGRTLDRRLVYVLDVATGDVRMVPGTGGARSVAWSPDGSLLAFAYGGALPDLLMVVPLRGGNPHRVARLSSIGGFSWRANGRELAYDDGRGIQAVDLASRRVRNVVDEGATEPEWSPDGSRMAYVHDGRDFYELLSSSEVFTSSTRGRGADHVTDAPSDSSDHHPAWRQDGRVLAFSRWKSDDQTYRPRSAIYVVAAGGGQVRRVTPEWLDATDPAWRPRVVDRRR